MADVSRVIRRETLFAENLILVRIKAAGILLRGETAQTHIARQTPEERNAYANEPRHTSNHAALNDESSVADLASGICGTSLCVP